MENFKGNILFTSHDQELCSTVANRIIHMENGKKVYDKMASYDEYIDYLDNK